MQKPAESYNTFFEFETRLLANHRVCCYLACMKILFLGDSLTQGPLGVSYVERLRGKLPEHTLINGGKSATRDPSVDLALSALDANGGSGLTNFRIRFAGESWQAWQPLTAGGTGESNGE